ncbi:hypothetical protein E4H04_10695 [Candidatus Bathyarchaeota archaeon]|nr:MAG: hypothetical protein E4H04_10695 [Candidatus Bathyarchaeota archaeon]
MVRTVENSLSIAEDKVAKFEKESTEKLDQMIEKAEAANIRIIEFEEKISRYRVELGQYKSLENLSKLFLGQEVPRGTKLLIMSTIMELLEDTLNYEGLHDEALALGKVKMNVFRRG